MDKNNIIKEKILKEEYFYKLIVFATIISISSLVPILYEIIQQKITSNIPYISLIFISIAFLIFMYISVLKGYYLHLFFYSFGLLCTLLIIYFKRKYDRNNITINKNISNIYKYKMKEKNKNVEEDD
jgi:hypothetical protein